jgi:hypothetical protein
MILVCIFFARKIDPWSAYKKEWIIALWGAICIFMGEMLFRIIAFYLIDQTATMDLMGFMIFDSFLLSIQAFFVTSVAINKIRDQSILLPLFLGLGFLFLLDFIYSRGWL